MNDLSCLLAGAVAPGRLAPEFDSAFYRATQADLAHLDEAGLRAHHADHGRDEGRCASPAALRPGFLAQIAVDRATLEIGPAVRPSLAGAGVRYFDIADRAGLIERAVREGYSTDRCPERIHYVSPAGDLDAVDGTFEAVFSSHCLEHQPDLVEHLTKVAARLRPGGLYHLLIPDKRYCFDRLLPESTAEDARRAHAEGRTVHAFTSVLEHHAMTTHNDAGRHWRGDHVDASLVLQQPERVLRAREIYRRAAGAYVDVHAWQFTPASFRALVHELGPAVPFAVERVYDTVRDRNEFGAVLRARPRG